MQTPFVSIIVLNFNGKHFLPKCLTALEQIVYPKNMYEVLLADNGSKDDSVNYAKTYFPWVKILCLPKNIGFGGGNNVAIKHTKGDYAVFLNNDTEVTKEWLSKLVECALKHSAPICSSKTLFMSNPDLIEYGGGKFTLNGRGYSIAFCKENNPDTDSFFTGYPCAASMLIRREVFLNLEGFDEDYFACLDDTDLGWRAWLYGYKVLFCSSSVLLHEAGGTAGRGRLSPIKAFYGTTAPIITILKNLEFQNLLLGIMLELSYGFIETVLLLRSGNLECIKMKTRAYLWLVNNLGTILNKRRIIQNKRKVSDKWLQNMNFLANPAEALKEYVRLSKLSPQK